MRTLIILSVISLSVRFIFPFFPSIIRKAQNQIEIQFRTHFWNFRRYWITKVWSFGNDIWSNGDYNRYVIPIVNIMICSFLCLQFYFCNSFHYILQSLRAVSKSCLPVLSILDKNGIILPPLSSFTINIPISYHLPLPIPPISRFPPPSSSSFFFNK